MVAVLEACGTSGSSSDPSTSKAWAEASGPDGSYDNSGNPIFARIGALMAPDQAPPIPRD